MCVLFDMSIYDMISHYTNATWTVLAVSDYSGTRDIRGVLQMLYYMVCGHDIMDDFG